MKTLNQNIKLAATKGKETIAQSDDVFTSWIDSDFMNWGTNKKDVDTKETELAVLEMDKDGTFEDIFDEPTKMCMTQGQIVEFCKNHKDLLHPTWATLFLFKADSEFFVAYVDVRSGGLEVYVDRFSNDVVWYSVDRHRVVVPQLALGSLESSPLETLTLSAAIEMVKKEGYVIYKPI